MKLHVIVDGYNLLGAQARGFSVASFMTEAARERLIADLSAYHHRKGHEVIVIFDGWRDGSAVEGQEFRSGVEVRYSKRGERADHVITRLADEWGTGCAVVSSDREVAHRARAAGAFVMGALEFSAKLGPAVSTQQAPVAWKKDEDGDGRSPRSTEKKGNGRKLPKAVRARRRTLKGF
ncbi:MAG: NYN domain-containing protein [Nitrospiraceae bacterium]